ncbi:MAG: hypothetical protein RR348_04145, partial [Clostridia bacterium]
ATFNGETNNTFTMVKNINGALMAFQNDSNTAQKFQVDQYFWKKASGASYIMTMYKENDGLIEIYNKDSFGKTTQLSYKKDGSKLIVTTTDTEHSEGNGWEFIVENGLLVCFKMPYIDQTGTGYVVENIMYNAKTAQDLKFAVGKTENDYTLATNQVRVSVELVIGDGQNASYIVGKRQLLCDRGTLLSGIKVTDLSEEQTYTSCQNPLTKDLETYFTFEGKYYDKQLTVPADGAKGLYDEQQIYWKVTQKTDTAILTFYGVPSESTMTKVFIRKKGEQFDTTILGENISKIKDKTTGNVCESNFKILDSGMYEYVLKGHISAGIEPIPPAQNYRTFFNEYGVDNTICQLPNVYEGKKIVGYYMLGDKTKTLVVDFATGKNLSYKDGVNVRLAPLFETL